jgi:hypothetical protein
MQQAIPIQHPMLLTSPRRGLDSLKVNHLKCKNFQFGCQMFEVDEVGDTSVDPSLATPVEAEVTGY